MKKLIASLFAVLALMACTATRNSTGAGAADGVSGGIGDSLRDHTFTVEVDYVMPRKMAPHILTSNYYVRVCRDSVVSVLPYFGVAYRADMSSSYASPLDFKGTVMAYDHKQTKRDRHRVSLKTRNHIEQIVYSFEVFDNGRATLHVTSTNREPITFSGTLKTE